jgi:hypothetical protein
MSLTTGAAPQRTGCPSVRIGVGIDTARYGHHATFLRPDLQTSTTSKRTLTRPGEPKWLDAKAIMPRDGSTPSTEPTPEKTRSFPRL